jgi:hypothetical protein
MSPLLLALIIGQSSGLPPLGVGLTTCSEYLASSETERKKFGHWVDGLLTGYNTFGSENGRALRFYRYDSPVIGSAIWSQCRANPNMSLHDAIVRHIDGATRGEQERQEWERRERERPDSIFSGGGS